MLEELSNCEKWKGLAFTILNMLKVISGNKVLWCKGIFNIVNMAYNTFCANIRMAFGLKMCKRESKANIWRVRDTIGGSYEAYRRDGP